MPRAVIVVDRHRIVANAHGRARITLRFVRAGAIRVRVSAPTYASATTTIRVLAAPRGLAKKRGTDSGGGRDSDGDHDDD